MNLLPFPPFNLQLPCLRSILELQMRTVFILTIMNFQRIQPSIVILYRIRMELVKYPFYK